jgi:preprotein translocase subunit YajC
MSILNILGIQSAPAQTVPTTTQPTTTGPTPAQPANAGFMPMIWMLLAFFVIFYFLLIRPQTQRAKQQRKLIDSLAVGNEVMTSAGIVGKIVKISDDFVVLNLAEGVDVTFQKGSVVTVLPKGTTKTV